MGGHARACWIPPASTSLFTHSTHAAARLRGVAKVDTANGTVGYVPDASTAYVASMPVTTEVVISILGGAGNDSVSFDTATLPRGVTFRFDGGAGLNTIIGPAADTTWALTGADSGSYAGVTSVHIRDIRGSPDNKDTFVLEPGGSVSGLLDGCARGHDTLVVAGRRGRLSPTAV